MKLEYINDDILHLITSFVCKKSFATIGVLSKRFYVFYTSRKDLPKLTSMQYMISPDNIDKLYREKPCEALYQGIARSIVDDYNCFLWRWCIHKLHCCGDLNVEVPKEIIKRAAKYGKLNVLFDVWCVFFGRSFALCNDEVGDGAAAGGHIHILQWARYHGCTFSRSTSEEAAFAGHLDVIIWLAHNGCGFDEWTFANAAENGQVHILNWLLVHGCSFNEDACARAARYGDLKIMQWLKRIGCPWDEEVCEIAAHCGHMDVLKWSMMSGCPVGERVCASAALNGSLENIKWLRENGCPWNEMTTYFAALKGHLDLLKWLIVHYCPFDRRSCYSAAARRSQKHVMEWIENSYAR